MADEAQGAGLADKRAAKEARTRGQRSLFIMVLLMFLVSIVVFVVGTYFFLVPQIMARDLEVAKLRLRMSNLEKRIEQPAPAAAPAAEAEHAQEQAPED